MFLFHCPLREVLSAKITLPCAALVVAVMVGLPSVTVAQSSPMSTTAFGSATPYALESDSLVDARAGGDVAGGSRSLTSAGTDEFLAEFCGDAELPRDLAGIKARERRQLLIDCAYYIYSYSFEGNTASITACRLTKQWTRTLNFGIVVLSEERCQYSGCGVNNIGAAESRFYLF